MDRLVRAELRQLYLCCRLVVEISEAGPEGGGKGRFVREWGRGPLYPYLHQHELGEVGSGPGVGVSIEQAKCDLHLEFDGGQRRVDQPGRQRERTLSATRGTKDCLRTKATVVTVRRADFSGNECLSGLTAATAVKSVEEARRQGDNAAECRGARSWEAFPAAAPGRTGGSLEGSLKAVRLPQFLEGDGDLLALDLYWGQRIGVQGRGGVGLVGLVAVAVWVVARDVDLLLGVEGVLKLRAVEELVSHGDEGEEGEFTWGPVLLLASMQQEPKPRVREDKYCPLKCRRGKMSVFVFGTPAALGSFDLMSRLRVKRQGKTKCWGRSTYLTEAMGRLCALVRAQLVRAQHADAAPGAVDNDVSVSGK
ncbi:predicted protein [Postia placenta Mad-698-R]|nr:predicted protein [Postia placenta Mad-698-R]